MLTVKEFLIRNNNSMISQNYKLNNLSGAVPLWLINLEKERLQKLDQEEKLHKEQRLKLKLEWQEEQKKREELLDLINPIATFIFLNGLIAIIFCLLIFLFR